MKKYIAIISLLLLFACQNDYYKEVNKYLLVDNQKEKIELVNGIYSRLIIIHNQDYFKLLGRSDDINSYLNYTFFHNGTLQCSASTSDNINYSDLSGEVYVNLYTAIVNINYLLSNLSVDKDRTLIGELYFLRAYSYFKLARLFGTPPLVEDIVVNYSLNKPTYAEVYQFIESDMLNAIDLLPETNSDARIPNETPHKGTAKALLAEIYLAMAGFPVNDTAKYAEAARLSGEVIEKADYYNFSLLPDYASLWSENNRHNSENIFGLFFSDASMSTINEIGAYYMTSNSAFDNQGSLVIHSSYNPERKFYATFPNNYRKEASFITGNYTSVNYITEDTTISIMRYKRYDPVNNPCDFVYGAFYKKWIDTNNEKYQIGNAMSYYQSKSEVTLYLLRYAQTLLTYAEAKARAGNLDQSAYEMVNRIRRRANNVDIYSPSQFDLPNSLSTGQFLDSVVCERSWELAGEPEGRWFDIIRLNMKDKMTDLRYKDDFPQIVSASYLTNDWYFYLIPEDDRWLNPNLK